VRSPLHCVTKRATRPTKSLSTLMRVPRCVKIPRRRNNIGRAYAVSRSLSLSLSLFLSPLLCALVSLPSRSSSRVRAEALRANCRWRLLSSLSLSLSLFLFTLFSFICRQLFIVAGVLFCPRSDGDRQIEAATRSILEWA